MNASKHWIVKHSYRFFVVLVVLAVSAGLTGARPLQSTSDALVQIELENESRLAALAETGISIYTSLYRTDGSLAMIALATPDQQQALVDRGFAVQVLEAGVQPHGIYGLYGTPEALDAASKVVKLLAVVDRQAVARMTDEQAQQAVAAGVALQPLSAQALIPPVMQSAALAETETATPTLVYNPVVQQMVNSLSQTTLYNYVAQLSGEQYANVGARFEISTRVTRLMRPISTTLPGLLLSTSLD